MPRRGCLIDSSVSLRQTNNNAGQLFVSSLSLSLAPHLPKSMTTGCFLGAEREVAMRTDAAMRDGNNIFLQHQLYRLLCGISASLSALLATPWVLQR